MTGSPTTTFPSTGPDGSKRLISTLTLTIFIQWMGASALIPLLPVYIQRLGGTDALAGVVMASFYAAGVLSQFPAGRLADRIGKRPVLVSGLILYGVASLAFLFPITASVAIVLRSVQGVGDAAAVVASLAMVSSSVAEGNRGRAFASLYGGELAGMAIGPLVGSIVGIRHMWVMFLASGVLSLGACIPALSVARAGDRPSSILLPSRSRPGHIRLNRSMTGALICGAALGLTTGVYDICWTLLLVARGASGLAIGISWSLFAVPFVAAAKPSGWLADHVDRRVLVLAGVGVSTVLCASYPFIHSVPALVVLGGSEALGFAAAMPAIQSLLTQGSASGETGRIQGMFGTAQTACTALAAAAAGAAFAIAAWLPFIAVAMVVAIGLGAAALAWRSVPGLVTPPRSGPAPAPLVQSPLVQSPLAATAGTRGEVQ